MSILELIARLKNLPLDYEVTVDTSWYEGHDDCRDIDRIVVCVDTRTVVLK